MSAISLFLLSLLSTAAATNITAVLSHYPNLSSFSNLLTTTTLADTLSSLSSPISLLAVPNDHLTIPSFPSSSTLLSDLLRLHILLRPLPLSPPPSGRLLPTLLQSTGRSQNPNLNYSLSSANGKITVSTTSTPPSTATVISKIQIHNNISIILIDSLLVLPKINQLTSESLSNSSTVNISQALTNSHGFNVFASILTASGLINDFQRDESGAGLTIFVPTDQAFADIPPEYNFQSLSADLKGVILRFHCIRSYYPLGSLLAIVNPLQPTLATETMGAGKYTLNVSGVTGKVVMDTGIVKSEVDQTVFDQNPVVIFGVQVVLLPKEIFGGGEVMRNNVVDGGGSVGGGGPVAEVFEGPPSPVAEVKSVAVGLEERCLGLDLVCIGLLYVMLLV